MKLREGVTVLVGVAGAAVLCLTAPAGAEVFRIEDADGVVHYTNNPCDPRYLRLAPRACPPAPAPAAPGAAEEPAAPAFSREIASTATRYGVDQRLVEAVVRIESAGNPRAVSPRGALGLMQLMPARAAALGVAQPFDPVANLDGGVRHLRELLVRYAGNLRLTLAAYNAGEDAVRVHGGVPPFPETQAYVRKVLSLYGSATPEGSVRAAARRPVGSPRL
jgi:soluble lytic murein transglycosylase-like protein